MHIHTIILPPIYDLHTPIIDYIIIIPRIIIIIIYIIFFFSSTQRNTFFGAKPLQADDPLTACKWNVEEGQVAWDNRAINLIICPIRTLSQTKNGVKSFRLKSTVS